MPRSLSQAGVGAAPVWVKADHCLDQPFYVASATTRTNKFGNDEIVFKLRLRDGVFDAEGTLHKIVHLSLADSGGQRADMVNYFRMNNDPLGPLVFNEIPTTKGNPFFQMVDAQEYDLAPRTSQLVSLPAKKDSATDADLYDLQELPF